MQKYLCELVFANIFASVNEVMDKRHAADEAHLEQMEHKTFDEYIVASVGELITADFQPALLNNKLLQQRALENTVETAINLQQNALLACPGVAGTLSQVIVDFSQKDAGADLLTTIMTKNPTPTLLRAALFTTEILCSIAAT